MSQKEHEELMQKLRDTLEAVSDEEDSPEEVFGTDANADPALASDEDMDAFDSYMAELLGDALDEGDRSAPRSRRKAGARRNAKKVEAEPRTTDREDEQAELMEPVEETDGRPEAQPSAYRDAADPFATDDFADDALPHPDVRAELPGEIFEDYSDESESEEPDAALVESVEQTPPAEKPTEENEPSFEVIEQLTILDALPTPRVASESDDAPKTPAEDEVGVVAYDAFEDEPTEDDEDGMEYSLADGESDAIFEASAVAMEDTVTEPVSELENAAPADDGNEAAEPSVEEDDGLDTQTSVEPEESASVSEPPAVEAENKQETDEPAPLVLEKGDILIDAEDELPPVAPKEAEEPVSRVEEPIDEPEPAAETRQTPSAPVPPQPLTEEPPRPKQSPLDALTAQRQGNVRPVGGGNSPFASRTPKERTLTDDDVELLLDLGYDNHLTQKVGAQRIETVRYRRQDDEKARRKLRNIYGCTGEEYSSHAQDKTIRATYRAHQKGATVRLVLSVILTALAFLADLFPLVRDSLPAEPLAFVPTTGSYGLIGLVLLLLAVLVNWPYLQKGVSALMHFSPVPASIPFLLLLIGLTYQVLGVFDEEVGVLLTFPTLMMLLLLAVGERMNVRRERLTFDVVAAHSRKIVMVAMPPRKKKVVREGHIVKIIDDDAGRRSWRVRPTDQVAGYFRRNAQSTPRYRTVSMLLLLAVAAALVVSVLTLIVIGQLRASITAFLLTLQMSLPTATLVSYAYPGWIAARKLAKEGSAILGQSAVDEYAGEKTLLFDDTEMFRSKSSTEITIKGSGDTKKYIRYAKRLFRTLGGTLRGVSTSDLSEETWEERVEILKIHEQGVEARIDGKVDILAGTSAFMVSQGIRVPGESAELLVRRNVESCILYLAFDGKLRLGYEIDYRISGRFEQMVTELAQSGTSVAVESCDPNLHEDFLTRSRRVGSIPISVVKPVRFERQTDSLLCDSGIVATRSARDAARATFMCDRLMENDARLARIHLVASVLGAVVALALSLFGLVRMTAGFIAALLQLLWCLPALLLSHRYLNNDEDSENEHANRNRE